MKMILLKISPGSGLVTLTSLQYSYRILLFAPILNILLIVSFAYFDLNHSDFCLAKSPLSCVYMICFCFVFLFLVKDFYL